MAFETSNKEKPGLKQKHVNPYPLRHKIKPFFRGLIRGEPLVEVAREGLRRHNPAERMKEVAGRTGKLAGLLHDISAHPEKMADSVASDIVAELEYFRRPEKMDLGLDMETYCLYLARVNKLDRSRLYWLLKNQELPEEQQIACASAFISQGRNAKRIMNKLVLAEAIVLLTLTALTNLLPLEKLVDGRTALKIVYGSLALILSTHGVGLFENMRFGQQREQLLNCDNISSEEAQEILKRG